MLSKIVINNLNATIDVYLMVVKVNSVVKPGQVDQTWSKNYE